MPRPQRKTGKEAPPRDLKAGRELSSYLSGSFTHSIIQSNTHSLCQALGRVLAKWKSIRHWSSAPEKGPAWRRKQTGKQITRRSCQEWNNRETRVSGAESTE